MLFFTSDLHFSHEKVIEYCNRPFSCGEEMDEALIKKWNSKVKPHDTVYVLGDFFFCNAEKAMKILDRLNGKISFIRGNHDKVINKSTALQQRMKMLPALYEEKINDTLVVMSHYPLLSWNKAHHGSFMLHGHAHGSIAFDPNYRRLDVGVDVHNYEPISWDEVEFILKSCNATDYRDR